MEHTLRNNYLIVPSSFFSGEETEVQQDDPENNCSPNLNLHEISP